MIKINLLRNSVANTMKPSNEATSVGAFDSGSDGGSALNAKELIIKVICLLVPIIGGVGTVSYTSSQKGNEIKQLVSLVESKKKEKTDLGPAIKQVDEFKKEKDRLQVQIDTIRLLSKERLRNVKALSALQDIMPEKAWLTRLKIEESLAQIEGSAVDDKTVADLMRVLDANIYFADVKLIRSQEQQNKDGVIKSFSIECKLEGI